MTIEQIKESFQRERKYRLWLPTVGIMSYPILVNEFVFTKVEDGVIFLEFTGLKDKNGKEIYEGDIYRRHNYLYAVMYSNGDMVSTPGFYGYCIARRNPTEKYYPVTDSKFYNIDADDITEVVGNIFENPEYL